MTVKTQNPVRVTRLFPDLRRSKMERPTPLESGPSGVAWMCLRATLLTAACYSIHTSRGWIQSLFRVNVTGGKWGVESFAHVAFFPDTMLTQVSENAFSRRAPRSFLASHKEAPHEERQFGGAHHVTSSWIGGGYLMRACVENPPVFPSFRSPPPPSSPQFFGKTPFFQLDTACATELGATLVTAVAIVVTAFPFRGVTALLRRTVCQLIDLIPLPRFVSEFFSTASAEEGEEGAAHTPPMTAALDALVTEEDIENFLSYLARCPTEGKFVEAAVASAATAPEEVVSNFTGGARTGGRQTHAESGTKGAIVPLTSAASGVEGGEWSEIHRGSTGTGTTYRMLRRNGPAPGTTDGGDRGLPQFKLEAVMEGVTAAQLARVQMNDQIRPLWDTTLVHGEQLASSASKETSSTSTAADGSELALWRMKFPMPMAPRDYLFVRRRWQTDDGTFYGITRDATGARDAEALAASVKLRGGGYRVRRIYSGQRIRAVTVGAAAGDEEVEQRMGLPQRPASSSSAQHSPMSVPGAGGDGNAAELVSIYHEDSGVPAAVLAMAACKGLLPFMRNLETAARGPLGVEGAEMTNSAQGLRHRHHQRRRLFGGKDYSAKRLLLLKGATRWPVLLSRLSGSKPRVAASLDGFGYSGENTVRVGRFGFRHGTKRMLSKLKDGIHRTVHKPVIGHENIHAEGRRRKLMVRAAGLIAMMAHVKRRS